MEQQQTTHPFPYPFSLTPDPNAKLRVLVRPVKHALLQLVAGALNEEVFHVGIENVDAQVVYHVSDPIGNTEITEIKWCETTLLQFADSVIYYHDPKLTMESQLAALNRAQENVGKTIFYNPVNHNCQSVCLEILFPPIQQQGPHLLITAITTCLDKLIASIPLKENEKTDDKNLDQLIDSFKHTLNQSTKNALKVAAPTFIMSMALPGWGSLLGALLGSIWITATQDDYESVINIGVKAYLELNYIEKQNLLKRIRSAAVYYGYPCLNLLASKQMKDVLTLIANAKGES